jgi:Tfp pilus assembly protein PilE
MAALRRAPGFGVIEYLVVTAAVAIIAGLAVAYWTHLV